jgi:hypothetical protein
MVLDWSPAGKSLARYNKLATWKRCAACGARRRRELEPALV